jgi:hypothetical protein
MMWTAAVAVLASSLAWLAVINLGLLLGSHVARLGPALVVARAMAHAALAVMTSAWPLALGALVAAAVMLAIARSARGTGAAEKEVRHA